MIVDASVAFKWLVREEGSASAIALIGGEELIAPTLLQVEIGNALWKKFKQGEFLPSDQAAGHLENIASLVRTVDETPMMGRALEMAMKLEHPIYDCVYLALADALDDVLVTADRKFLNVVSQSEYVGRIKGLS